MNTSVERVRPLIRSVCGEAQRLRGRLLASHRMGRAGGAPQARKWLIRASNRWPQGALRELTRRELDLLAGCLYGVASAIGEEPEAYRRVRLHIGRLLAIPTTSLESEAEEEAMELQLL